LAKLKIVFITPSLGAGGIERVVSIYANYFVNDNNIEVKVICFKKKETFYDIDPQIEIINLPDSDFRIFKFLKKLYFLRRKLFKYNPDAMISFGSMYNSYFLLSTIGLRKKKFVSDRSNPWRNSKLFFNKRKEERHDGMFHYFLKKFTYPMAYKILAQTKLSANIEQNNFGLNKVLYFPNPIKPIDLNMDEKEKIILCVGRFVRSKNQESLLKIFASLPHEQRMSWRLKFIGGGDDYFKFCQELSVDLKISEYVDFLGFEKNVDYWYRRSAIFAFTSISEGFPNALAEAMSYGCACISYDCIAGPSDLIDNHENGILIDLYNEEMFIHELSNLLVSRTEMLKLQINARKKVGNFTIEKLASLLADEIF
jgi:GalNAc-alpha-(1->4)-GalNAc-alpha-(1->3)-diNAcBac-PP-undecaprenol alpha-1,4-N-acetyl-D-galactosaminyltransferase